MSASSLELAELLEVANRQREQIPELADTDPFTERTIYYYVQQGLLPRASRRRGPGTTYPADFVDRLLFIRRLQKEQSLTLAHIREVMGDGTPRTIHNVAHGNEPLEIRLSASEKEVAERADRGEQTLSLRSRFFRKRRSEPEPQATYGSMQKAPADRSAESGDDLFSLGESDPVIAEVMPEVDGQRRYSIGPDATLLLNKALTPLQEKRLAQVVALLRSILDEPD